MIAALALALTFALALALTFTLAFALTFSLALALAFTEFRHADPSLLTDVKQACPKPVYQRDRCNFTLDSRIHRFWPFFCGFLENVTDPWSS